jgi:molecular chaperone GrpE (heat shock protein)
MTNRSPTLLKWPFILADVLLLVVCAWLINKLLPARSTGDYLIVAIAATAWIIGAFICIWPWLIEFKAQTQQFQNESLTDALKQIERLEEIGARVQSATASWQMAQDSALRVTQAAKEIQDRIKTDSKDFMEFAERINNDEKQNLRLEVEKLRRTEAEWLQVAARMLDHTFALTAAAARSGQPNLVTQMTNFQTACRDAARRVGLIPFHPAAGDAFDERSQQLEDANAKPEEGAVVADVLATGFTFQGQLLRKALVRVSQNGSPGEAQPTETIQETPVFKPEPPEPAEPQQEQTAVAEQAEEIREEQREEPQAEAEKVSEEPIAEESFAEASPEAVSETQEPIDVEERVVEVAAVDNETAAETAGEISGQQTEVEEDKPRRRQRKPDPQTSLPF